MTRAACSVVKTLAWEPSGRWHTFSLPAKPCVPTCQSPQPDLPHLADDLCRDITSNVTTHQEVCPLPACAIVRLSEAVTSQRQGQGLGEEQAFALVGVE